MGPYGQSGRAEYLVPTGIRFRNVEPVVSRYTYRATRPTPPSSAEVKERVQLYLYSTFGPSWPLLRLTLL